MPFFVYLGVINGNWASGGWAWLVIFSTHAVIDRMAIASTFCRLNNLLWLGGDAPAKDDNGYCTTTPPYVRFWLVVIVDNTLHLCINHIALNYLNV